MPIKDKVAHKKKYKENKSYSRYWDARKKRKEKERKKILKNMSVSNRISGIIGNFFGSILVIGIVIAVPVGGWIIGGSFILDFPYYVFHQFETKTGIYQGWELVSEKRNLSYKEVYIGDTTLIAETDFELNNIEGEKVTIKYLPHTKLIMKISE